MSKIRILLVLMSLSGCDMYAPTPYQKLDDRGGYDDLRIGEGMYKVSFRGNAFIGRETASDYALMRCAEVALGGGYRYFILLEDHAYSKSSFYHNPDSKQTGTMHKPRIRMLIQCFIEKPDNPGVVYDAEFTLANLRIKYDFVPEVERG